MATKRQRGSSWEYIVKKKGVLHKPISMTFSTEKEGDEYIARLEALLSRGVVPQELLDRVSDILVVDDAIRAFVKNNSVPDSDRQLLSVLLERVGTYRMTAINYEWVENWIAGMKREHNLAPSTIRHYAGALARCFDWVVRKHPSVLPNNPIRLLPRRYASYTDFDAAHVDNAKENTERDRRLQPGELERIYLILSGDKPEDRQRPLELWLAMSGKNKEAFEELLKTGADYAAAGGGVSLRYEVTPNGGEVLKTEATGTWKTMLNEAALYEDSCYFNALLAAGADPNLQDGYWLLPLAKVMLGPKETLKTRFEALLAAGANINLVDGLRGLTLLHSAAEFGHVDIIDYLIKMGLSIDASCDQGQTALHSAVIYKQMEVAKKLLSAGANLDIKFRGMTALYIASQHGDLDGNYEMAIMISAEQSKRLSESMSIAMRIHIVEDGSQSISQRRHPGL